MKFKVSIVAIFKNEHRFIVQWIEYHLKAGVDHFYLYDNGGDHWDLLTRFKEKITYTPWTDDIAKQYKTHHKKQSRQIGAYTHCIEYYRNETEWLQLLDLDEFLVPRHVSDVKGCLSESNSEETDGFRIPRYNFGNAGKWKMPVSSDVRLYTRRERYASHFKDIGRMESITKIKNPHVILAKGEMMVSTDLYIHHHYTRSLLEWTRRAKTGGGQAGKGFRTYIGQRPWLAFLSYCLLNLRSIYPIVLIVLLSATVLLFRAPIWLTLLNIPLITWALFAWQRGQNEVMDERLKKLLDN
jgi:hypothetical protein